MAGNERRDITHTAYNFEPERGASGRMFCIVPSNAYMQMLEDCGEDPRSVAGVKALMESGPMAEGGWKPTWDARERIEQ